MSEQEQISPRRRGRKPTGQGTPILVRLQPDLLAALDRFIADGEGQMSRPEALRHVFRDWAIGHGYLASEAVAEDTPAAGRG